MSRETAVFDPPPAPPAYVEVVQELSAPSSKEIIETLKHLTSRGDGHEPPHDHVEEPPPTPPLPDEPPGQGFTAQEVARRRYEEDITAWRVYALRVQLFNQSGTDSTLPMATGTDKSPV